MKKYFAGIDSGSTMCKSVLFDGETILDINTVKTGWNPKLSSAESLGVLLERNNISKNDVYVSTTGYGREAVDFADYSFTEITCHAYGGIYLIPNIQGIIDIGGQDSKVIEIKNGKVVNFFMNDKCAAGTGRFLSMASETLDIDLKDIDAFSDLSDPVSINSMCTVFAESEIIGLLAMQSDRSKIMAGVLYSIAKKIQQQSSKLDFSEDMPLLMTGGLTISKALIDTIATTIGHEVITHKYALHAGAIGACICANKQLRK
ncbi:MAG: acyl-CoA dehydratase activase [Eubacteriales bacterium]|nr:acyl-CoA dehydratase activase [Eubacteriales bacterium]MDD4389385.1 acyl-CoA dehydratase activase [Eubacteriales bacterium]